MKLEDRGNQGWQGLVDEQKTAEKESREAGKAQMQKEAEMQTTDPKTGGEAAFQATTDHVPGPRRGAHQGSNSWELTSLCKSILFTAWA